MLIINREIACDEIQGRQKHQWAKHFTVSKFDNYRPHICWKFPTSKVKIKVMQCVEMEMFINV